MKTSDYPEPNSVREVVISVLVLVMLAAASVLFLKDAEFGDSTAAKTEGRPSDQSAFWGQDALIHFDSLDIQQPNTIHPFSIPDETRQVPPRLVPGCVSPPIPALDILPVVHRVNANGGDVITTKTFTRIEIPPNAFVDGAGNAVNGSVDIAYREFRNFHDIFLSGIPMHYDSGGVRGMLESAGMIEIGATKENKPVFLNPDKKINIHLASVKSSGTYGLYFYDEKKNQWKYKGEDAVNMETPEALQRKPAPRRARTYDLNFTAQKYYAKIQCVSDMTNKRKNFLSKKKVPEVFEFRMLNTEKIIPEMKEIRNFTWRYTGPESVELFTKLFGKEKIKSGAFPSRMLDGPTEFRVEENEATGALYHFKFRLDSGEFNIQVEPVFANKYQKKRFDEKWQAYLAKKENRKNSAWTDYSRFKQDSAGFTAKFANEEAAVLSSQTVALRTFEIDGFGIWNCDRQFTPAAANMVVARFVDESGKPLLFKTGFFVEKERNSVYTMMDFDRFRFDPNSNNIFWTILKDDKLAIVYPDEFERHKTDKRGSCTFVMKVSDNALDSYSNLQKALSFN